MLKDMLKVVLYWTDRDIKDIIEEDFSEHSDFLKEHIPEITESIQNNSHLSEVMGDRLKDIVGDFLREEYEGMI